MQGVIIGADHGGFDLKEQIKEALEKKGFSVTDVGCFDTGSCDYPDFAHQVTGKVCENPDRRGILICKSGIGMSISANKRSGIRAGLCYNPEAAKLCRLHNDANVLVMGSSFVSSMDALTIVDSFLETEFEGGRHVRRVLKIEEGVQE